MSKPAILFVHGAWHTLAAYEPFLARLRAMGYTVVAPFLPSAGAEETPTDPPGADIAAVRAAALALIDDDEKEVVAVGHSYGGVVITDAMAGLGVASRAAEGKKGGVKRLVYVCAIMPGLGECLEDSAGVDVLGWCYYEDDLKLFRPGADIGPIFYSDLPPAEQQCQLSLLVRHPRACSFRPVTGTAYAEIPTTFVYCERDAAFPYAAQQAIVEGHKARGVRIDEVTLDSAHFPSLSMPDRLAEVVDEWAGV